MKQHNLEQLQLAHLLERFPHYVMVLHAEDLTIQTVSPSYQQLLGHRDTKGRPVSEVFSGSDLDQFMKLLRRATREKQTLQSSPLAAHVIGAEDSNSRLVHTIVPILDENGANIDRLFIYSDKAEG